MSNYERRIIADLRRSQGKALGKLDARIDRVIHRLKGIEALLVQVQEMVAWYQDLVPVHRAIRDPPPPEDQQG